MNEAKEVAKNHELGQKQSQLFDNQLVREFISLDGLKAFLALFDKNRREPSTKWCKQQMILGNLPYSQIGKGKFAYYIPHVRQAILENRLAPNTRKVQSHDRNTKNKVRNQISSSGESAGAETLEDFRREKRRREMGELYPFPTGSGS